MVKKIKKFPGLLLLVLLLLIPAACSLQQASSGSSKSASFNEDVQFAASTVAIEAESMSKSGYSNESNTSASGGVVVKLSGTSGSVSKSFSGTTAAYDISVVYIDQISGAATFTLTIGSATIGSWTGDQATTADIFATKLFSNITVANGAAVKLSGTKNGSELAKYDVIKFTPTGSASSSSAATTSSSSSSTTTSSVSSSSSSSSSSSTTSSSSSSSTATTSSSSSISSTSTSATSYYIAPNGSDSNSGSITSPFYTINQAMTVAKAGDYIYLRGGSYAYTSTQTLSKSGTAAALIHIYAYSGEKPLLSWQTWAPSSSARGAARGIYLTGDYYYIKGLDISYAPDNGMKLEGSHNTIELCAFHHNGDSGLQVGLKSNAANDGSLVSYNYILNCDAYRNVDPATSYENADGFACKLYPGKGNKFYGCRSWENCDDGWDLYEAEYLIELENCWTWNNGDPTIWGFTSFNGDGNGFKLGGNGVAGGHLVKNCVAFNNKQTYSRGFHQNNNSSGITLYNCLAFGNTVGFGLNDAVTTSSPHVLKNNIAFGYFANPSQSGSSDVKLIAGSVSDHNSWDLGLIITTDDFVSLSVADALAARQADGSLPPNFARLKTTSIAIDKGINVGIPYLGAAPDLGAYECK